jgi:DNA recombination protein RmuC
MNTAVIVLSCAIVVFVGVLGYLFYAFSRKRSADSTENQAIGDLQKSLNQMQVQMMEHLANQLNNVRGSMEQSSGAVNREAQNFTRGLTQMQESLKQMQESVNQVRTSQDIFKSPKLRGNWGEASLEHLLAEFFPREVYELQKMFSTGDKADACVHLPNHKLISIDAKFPVDNFMRLSESKDDRERELLTKSFMGDVKKQVDEIATKYILPSEGTLDYAIMYLPAEAIYYEIINPATKSVKDDVMAYAWGKKVIITSPNLFYLTLKTLEHWFNDVQLSRQTQEVVRQFERIRKDSEKLMDDFRKLGKHLNEAQSSYDDSEKRLGLMSGKVDRLTRGKLDAPKAEEPEQLG